MLALALFSLLPLFVAPVLAEDLYDFDRGVTSDWDLTLMDLQREGILKGQEAESEWRTGGSKYGPFCFQQNKSHFDESQAGQKFCQRYLQDASHYKPGGPVYIYDIGESHKLPDFVGNFISGLLAHLTQRTNGLAIVLEHRYYGGSVPTPDYSTDNLRWLNNKEALEDSANFIRNFPTPEGIEKLDPATSPFIYIGGSYPGGRALFMRKLHPELVWGALGSSAVVHAQTDMPEWFGSIEQHAPEKCVQGLVDIFQTVDRLLDAGEDLNKGIKAYLGFDPAISNGRFADLLKGTFSTDWQRRSWKSPEASQGWGQFCAGIEAGVAKGDMHVDTLGGAVPAELEFMKARVKEVLIDKLAPGLNATALNSGDHPKPDDVSLKNQGRVWRFQTCTEWGYSQGAPKDPNARRVVSKYSNVERWLEGCQQKFAPGEHYRIPAEPDVSKTNQYGDFAIAGDRMATVDGEWDPWRPMAVGAASQPKRDNTLQRPYWVIPQGAHCWDLGARNSTADEPADMQKIHEWEFQFIDEWLKQFREEKGGSSPTNKTETRRSRLY